MAFPLSPSNGQQATLNGILYSFNASTQAWVRVPLGMTLTTYLNITNTTGTNSTNTGALTVAGGVGVAGGLYVGGTITATNLIVNGYTVNT